MRKAMALGLNPARTVFPIRELHIPAAIFRRCGAILVGLCFAAAFVAAPSRAEAETRLTILGTAGGPLLQQNRAGTSNLLTVDGTHYLIDAGDGVGRQITRAGVKLTDVRRVFLTHLHDDHTIGLATLLSFGYTGRYGGPVDIYGPPETTRMIKGLWEFFAVHVELRSPEKPLDKVFFPHDVAPGRIYEDSNVTVTAVENSHYGPPSSSADGKTKSYAFRFQTRDRVIVFTGDTGPSDAVADLAAGADILVSEVSSPEAMIEYLKSVGLWQRMSPATQASVMAHMLQEHLTPQEVGKLASRAGVKKVVLTHFGPPPMDNDDVAQYRRLVAEHFRGEVIVATDLMQF